MRLPILFVVAFAAACTPSADGYGDAFVKLSCQRYEECAQSDFEADFSSQSDCVETIGKDYGPVFDCQAQACDYNKKAAAACLSESKKQTCEEYTGGTAVSDCNNVYTNCNAVALATCAADAGFDTSL